MAVHKDWRDPIVLAQNTATETDASVRVVRSRVDPAWVRVEQPYGVDPPFWIAYERRVAGMTSAIRGLSEIVATIADQRTAWVERERRYDELHELFCPLQTHGVCPVCTPVEWAASKDLEGEDVCSICGVAGGELEPSYSGGVHEVCALFQEAAGAIVR